MCCLDRGVIVALVALALPLALGPVAASAPEPPHVSVSLKGCRLESTFLYSPGARQTAESTRCFVVKSGSTFTFRNMDTVRHYPDSSIDWGQCFSALYDTGRPLHFDESYSFTVTFDGQQARSSFRDGERDCLQDRSGSNEGRAVLPFWCRFHRDTVYGYLIVER